MDKLVRTRKGSIPFQIDFATAKIEELKKEKKLKDFQRSVKGALYFLPNSTKKISEHEFLYIQKYHKTEAKVLFVVRDVALKKKEEPKKAEETGGSEKPSERSKEKEKDKSKNKGNK